MVPGLAAYLIAISAVLLTALTIASEWERGSMEQLFASPVGRLEIVLGKLLPYLALGMIELLIVVGILGILSGVVTLGVTQFIGKGKTEASATELHNVQTAVAALMSDQELALLDEGQGATDNIGQVGPPIAEGGPGTEIVPGADIGPYLTSPLAGTYDVINNGKVQIPAP